MLDLADLLQLHQKLFVDADHVGDKFATTKSTTGAATILAGPRSWCPLDWHSRTQQATTRSTPEAEVVALDGGTFGSAAALSTFWEAIVRHEFKTDSYTDNEGGRCAVKKGSSKKLAYLRKHQRVSIGALAEFYRCPNNQLKRTPSNNNPVDVLTKPLEHGAHWMCIAMLGLGVFENPPKCVPFQESAECTIAVEDLVD